MPESTSCIGCKFLYLHDYGYSDWTVENTTVLCALDRNEQLPQDAPRFFPDEGAKWPPVRDARCSAYQEGEMTHINVDFDAEADRDFVDPIILEHAFRK